MNKEAFEFLKPEHLTPDLRLIYNTLGKNTLIELFDKFQSTEIYIPKITRLREFCLNYYDNAKTNKSDSVIANDLGVSKKYLNNLIKERRKEKFNIFKEQNFLKRRKNI